MTTELDAMLKRLHMPTVRRLWKDLEDRAQKEGMRYADYLQGLVAEEIAHRAQTRVARMTRRAKFPFLRTVEEFDFAYQTSMRKELLGSYLGPEFVHEGRNLILHGPSGVGKTHLAVAVAYKAIQNGSDARFVTAAHLIDELSGASREGTMREAIVPYTHAGVLVADEVGYLSYGPDAANVLFQVVNDRYLHRRPVVFTTNKPVEDWGRVLHDADLAEAILDRVLERGRILQLKGPSYRTRHLQSKEGSIISGKRGPEFPEPTIGPPGSRRARGGGGSLVTGCDERLENADRCALVNDGQKEPGLPFTIHEVGIVGPPRRTFPEMRLPVYRRLGAWWPRGFPSVPQRRTTTQLVYMKQTGGEQYHRCLRPRNSIRPGGRCVASRPPGGVFRGPPRHGSFPSA